MGAEGSLTIAMAALRAGKWVEARGAFESLSAGEESEEVLRGLGETSWWLGETQRSIHYYKRAYRAARESRNHDGAVWAALWLALTYGSDLGNSAAFNGWLARAERIVRDAPAVTMCGWTWLVRAYGTTQPDQSSKLVSRALEFARAQNDRDLEICALAQEGSLLVARGSVEPGLVLVDEAMAAALGGECRHLVTVVFTCCSMIVACELAADVQRADQWCRVADEFIREYGCPFLRAQCRVGYGSVLVAAGRWSEAERQLTLVERTTEAIYPPFHRLALSRLAELRIHQGRLEEAEEMLTRVVDDASARVGLARLRLAQGDAEGASEIAGRLVGSLQGRPVELARALALLCEARLSSRDWAGCEECATALEDLAAHNPHEEISARALDSRGSLLLTQGAADASAERLERAAQIYLRLSLPFEAARSRLQLARALAGEQRSVAAEEAHSALVTFEELGAALHADAAAAVLRGLGEGRRTGPRSPELLTPREHEVFRLMGLGLSNPEIAQRLVISRKTAAHHVSSVLSKLNLRNRSQAAAYASRLDRPVAPVGEVERPT